MTTGFLLAVVGFVLVLLNYSNNPGPFNLGVAMFFGGVVLMGISAFRRDRTRQHTNGNGA